MYTKFFGLQESPFSIAPDPGFLYMSERHKEALAHLMYGLSSGSGGFILLTGEVGTGKTTVSRSLLQELPEKTDLAFILNPALTELELLATVCDEFALSYNKANLTRKELVDTISQFLLDNHQRGRHSVLLIDEAQHIGAEVLEQLRLLTNLETDKKKLLQIILIGQPELQQMLKRDELRQLAQRITARYHLLPLTQLEVSHYIRHRLSVAGCIHPVFGPKSLKEVHRQSGGVPRLINLICDRAMLSAFANSDHKISPLLIKTVAKEVLGQDVAPDSKGSFYLPALVCAGLAVAGINIYLFGPHFWPTNTRVQTMQAESQAPTETVEVKQAEQQLPLEEIKPVAEVKPAALPVAKQSAANMVTTELPIQLATQEVTTPPEMEIQHRLEELVESSRSTGAAMKNLYRVWGYDVPLAEANCDRIKSAALTCFKGRGSILNLKSINHPAMIQMLDQRGVPYYVALVGFEQGAELLINENRIRVSESWFNRYWTGEYTLFWQPPVGYQKALKVGSSGSPVQWLDNSLAEIYQLPRRNINYFDAFLAERVRAFQQKNNLDADGIAGTQTLLRINQAVTNNMPKLREEG